MRRSGLLTLGWFIALAAGLCAASPARARVMGRVSHVGFPASVGDVVRSGLWTPVAVDLALENQSSFDGYLRVGQRDKDGDIAYDLVPVHLRNEVGPRPYMLYTVAAPVGQRTLAVSVDVLDEDDNLVEVFTLPEGEPTRSLKPAQLPLAIPDDFYLILEISDQTLGPLQALVSDDQRDKYYREIILAHMDLAHLPDHWLGLEMVDCIVWEAADATALTEMQLQALVGWVRQGGLLMIAAGRTADTLAKSEPIKELLPVQIGPTIATRDLPTVLNKLLGVPLPAEDDALPLAYRRRDRPVTLAVCQTGGTAETVLREKELEATVVARKTVGLGHVVFVAAELRELCQPGTKPAEFFKRTLQLPGARAGAGDQPETGELFSHLDNAVGFRSSTGLYLLGAVMFSVVYVGVATFGSWGFLRSRRWTKHAWTAFGVVAGGAAVLSLLAVQAMRGVTQSLHQLTIVDAQAGDTEATATVYFGLKTGMHSLVDVWMPDDYALQTEPQRTDCYLKPLPSSAGELSPGSSYADPTRYQLRPASAELLGVPIRATLKQFEGRWSGKLRQTIHADIRLGTITDPDDGMNPGDSATGVLPGSSITNDLSHALTDCYIFQPLRDMQTSFVDQTPRHNWIQVFPIGDIAAGQQIDLAARMYTDQDSQSGRRMRVETWVDWTLGENVKNWDRSLRGGELSFRGGSDKVPRSDLEPYQDALLLVTALTDHWPGNLPGTFSAAFDYSRRHCRQLDCSSRLTSDMVMLIGFAEDQGPVTLCTRRRGEYRPLAAEQALTMYRFVIPITKR